MLERLFLCLVSLPLGPIPPQSMLQDMSSIKIERGRARHRGDGSLPHRPRSCWRDSDLASATAIVGKRLHAGAGHRQGRRWAVVTCSTAARVSSTTGGDADRREQTASGAPEPVATGTARLHRVSPGDSRRRGTRAALHRSPGQASPRQRIAQ